VLLNFASLDRRSAYFWMASTIAPRPVAWVSTLSASGVANLAPFSFFQMIAPHPPTLMICPQHGADGRLKDTARNIQDTGEFVVSLVSYAMVQQMNGTSFSFDSDTSEFEQVGIASLPSEHVAPRRVDGAPMSFECRVADFRLYPEQPHSTCTIVLGAVIAAHADESILAADGSVDPLKLDTVSRMGADWYGRTNSPNNFSLPRPTEWVR
jgi:flavin reductase (DIM6/NTAB) family NADH-FMN oxidoreductase RutF